MSIRRLVGTVALVAVVFNPFSASADSVAYTFNGVCASGVGDGCGAFSLQDGDDVMGRLVFDSANVGPGQRLILNPSNVAFEFSFSFGDLVLSNASLGDAAFEVFFLQPDANELHALSAPLPWAPLISKYLLLGARRVDATEVFAVSRNEASATGVWTRELDAAPVPEPGTLLLLATGVAAIGRRVCAQRQKRWTKC